MHVLPQYMKLGPAALPSTNEFTWTWNLLDASVVYDLPSIAFSVQFGHIIPLSIQASDDPKLEYVSLDLQDVH